ncbi:retrovirus-related pol polyprotein from transposon TNT 1-94 [Tanacetum coccineum]
MNLITSKERHIREPIWYLDSGCSRSMTGVKSYLHKYVEQPGPKVVFGDNSSCITEGYGSINYRVLLAQKKCLHLLHMDLFGPVSLMSINHEKYTLVIVDEYSRMVENQNDVKVKQIRTNNGTEFRNHELESFCDEKGISQNFSSPYTLEQNGVAERKNKTLIEAARTMLNGSVLSKHFWTKAVRIACCTQNKSISVKRHDKTPYEIFRERIPDISYFHMFGCPVFIHNHKDHLGKFDAKADDGYNSLDHISLLVRSRQVCELTQENHVPEVIVPNKPNIPLTKDNEGPPDLINTEGTHEQNIKNEQIITQPTKGPSGNNTEVSVWSKDQHIELVNIIGDPGEGMLTRSMAAKLITASASECLFADFLSEIETKKTGFAQGYSVRKKEMTMMKDLCTSVKGRKPTRYPSPSFESNEFPDHVCKLDKALYGLKQALKACSSVKIPMVPPNNLGPDLAGKPVNETSYRGMIGSLMYLKGTPTLGLYYPKCSGFDLKGYSDSDYAGCNMDRKSTSAEAEYVAAAGCCASILWMKSQLSDYDIHYKMVPIFCDNTSAIAISNNPVLHSRTKHIDIRYHFIRDHILKGDIELHFIPTEYQLADIFTKPLDEPTFTRLKAELGMLNID